MRSLLHRKRLSARPHRSWAFRDCVGWTHHEPHSSPGREPLAQTRVVCLGHHERATELPRSLRVLWLPVLYPMIPEAAARRSKAMRGPLPARRLGLPGWESKPEGQKNRRNRWNEAARMKPLPEPAVRERNWPESFLSGRPAMNYGFCSKLVSGIEAASEKLETVPTYCDTAPSSVLNGQSCVMRTEPNLFAPAGVWMSTSRRC